MVVNRFTTPLVRVLLSTLPYMRASYSVTAVKSESPGKPMAVTLSPTFTPSSARTTGSATRPGTSLAACRIAISGPTDGD